MEEKDEKGFTIRDRRTFSSEEPKTEAREQPTKQQEGTQQKPSDAARAEEQKENEAGPVPELDFSSFVLSLATTAQVSLGLIPNPQTNLTAQNLPAAKQMIDIIGMLKDKTSGNLTAQEQALIDNILYSLRMQFISAAGGKK